MEGMREERKGRGRSGRDEGGVEGARQERKG